MSVIPPHEDIITMAYNASLKLIKNDNKMDEELKNNIDMVIFATESSIDNSKSSAVVIHNLLGLKENCRCIDVKQACYGGTGAINFAKNYLISEIIKNNNNNSKILVIMSDIAYYGLNTSGEATQGCGAIAVLISFDPKVCIFEDGICNNANNNTDEIFNNVVLTNNCNDFYRPNYFQTPLYDGHFSIKHYLKMFYKAKKQFKNYDKLNIICCHMPFANMIDKCIPEQKENSCINEDIKYFTSLIGNIYTGSLYLGLSSLIMKSQKDLSSKHIGMFSYGSGSECELFAIQLLQNYKKYVKFDIDSIKNRIELDYDTYCLFWKTFAKREKSLNWEMDLNYKQENNTKIYLVEIENGVRKYETFC